jgi:hypothetical protein
LFIAWLFRYIWFIVKKNQNVFCLSALMLMLITTGQGSFCITTALIQYKYVIPVYIMVRRCEPAFDLKWGDSPVFQCSRHFTYYFSLNQERNSQSIYFGVYSSSMILFYCAKKIDGFLWMGRPLSWILQSPSRASSVLFLLEVSVNPDR